jgi:hypothetical protein
MTVLPFNYGPSPIILDNQSNIYFAWMDWRSGMGDIYFKKGIRTEPSNETGNNGFNGNSIDNGMGNWIWILGFLFLFIIIVVIVTRTRSNIHK